MVYPLLPAFVTGVLGGGAVALGALDGAADAAAALVKLVAGRLADRPSRRGPLIVIGYLVAVVVRPVIAVTAAAWQVVGLRVVDRLGKGLRTPPRDALIADVTPEPIRGRAFGLQRGLDHVGAVIGPLVAWWMLSTGADVRKVIVASLVPGVLVLVLAMWAVKDQRRETAGTGAVSVVPPLRASSRFSPPFTVVAISLFYLLRIPETLMILRAQQLGIAVALVPLLWAALHVVRSSTSFIGGALSDRIGPSRTMWIGWLTYVALAAGMAFATGPTTARPLPRAALAVGPRCGVRRHRHQPAVRPARGVPWSARHSRHTGECARRALADLLVVDAHRDSEIPRRDHPRRQQGRGRGARADGVGERQPSGARAYAAAADDRPRHLRRGVALRRRRTDTRDLRSFGGGRARDRGAGAPAMGDLDNAGDPGRSLHVPEPRHRRGRRGVWTDHVGVVFRDRRSGRERHPASPGRRGCRGAHARHSFLCRRSRARAARSGRRLPGRHRRGSAVCGPGALRPYSDPTGVVHDSSAGADAELFRPGRPAADQSRGRGQPFLSSRAREVVDSAHPARHRGRDHCIAGRHLRRIFAHAPGGAARLHPADGHRAHVIARDRADLRAIGQQDAGGADDCARP